ncbi:MAG TPA: hypothetical protein VIR02_18090 [Anaerolineales bacterium]
MENTIHFQSEQCLDADALFLAPLKMRDVNRTFRNIQTLVVVLLQYALTGISITNSLIRLIAPGDEGFGCSRKEK